MRGRREQMQSDARTIGNRFCGTASGPSSSLRIRLGANNSRHGIRPELVSVELNIGRCILPGSPQEKPATGSCRANPSSVAESHAPEIFADEFVMLSRKIQKPPAGNPLFPPSLPPRTASPPPLPPSPAPRVTPAVPVSISVRWSIAILALSPPLAPLLSIPDRLSLCDSSSPPLPPIPAPPPLSLFRSNLIPCPLASSSRCPRVSVSRFSIPRAHVKRRWTCGWIITCTLMFFPLDPSRYLSSSSGYLVSRYKFMKKRSIGKTDDSVGNVDAVRALARRYLI